MPSSHSTVLSLVAVERVRKAKPPALSRKTTGSYGVDSGLHRASALLSEVDVASDDRVVLAQRHAVGVVAAVLAGHVGVAGAMVDRSLMIGRSSLRAMGLE